MNSNFRAIVRERLQRVELLLSEAIDGFAVSEVMTAEEYDDYLTARATLFGFVDSLKY